MGRPLFDKRLNLPDGLRLRDSSDIEVLDNVLVHNLEFGVRARSTTLDATLVRGQNQLTGNVEGDVRVED